MKLFFDSWILISLLDGHGSPGLDEVRDRLCAKGHQLAVSPTLVFELAAPLSALSTETNVMRRLIDLETLPTAYLADSQIARRELVSAIQAFGDCREYVPVDPYVERFDAAIPPYGPAPTAIYLHLRRNVGDQPEASDFGDFAHVRCTPYVDLMTLDRRMADYVRRSGQGWPDDPARRLRHDLSAVLQEL